jgi:DUF4097 and DUF4098 domain-containing protein YvlB
MKHLLISSIAALALVAVTGVYPLRAQSTEPTLKCDPGAWRINGLETFCKIVDIPAPYLGSLDVKSGNGAITIRAWDEPTLFVRARIDTAASSVFEAMLFADRIAINVSGARIEASGPQSNVTLNWSVTLEILVPRNADLSLTAGNGAIAVSDVAGRIDFKVGNGAVSLTNVAGQVTGTAGNGAIVINLGGDHWDGAGVNVKTGNGAITVHVPQNYSAHFEASATIGVISTNYPVHVSKGKWGIPGLGGSLSFDAGAGGAPIHVATTVGAIKIQMEP